MSASSFPASAKAGPDPFHHKHNATDQRPVPTSEKAHSTQLGQ
jgi:hypothetical protein